jgi:hypothetical protein
VGLAPAVGLNTDLLMTTTSPHPQSGAERGLAFATSAAELTKPVSTYKTVEVFTYFYAHQEKVPLQVLPAAPMRRLQPCRLQELAVEWVPVWMRT